MKDFFTNQIYLISFGGKYIYLAALVTVLVSFLLAKHKYYKALVYVTLSLLSYIFANLLKAIFQEARPETAGSYTFFYENYSFPSSHVLVYTVVFGFLIFLLPKLRDIDKLIRYSLNALSIYLIAAVGLSRVALGEHMIRDVIGGYAFGAFYLLVLIQIYKKGLRKYSVPKDKD